MVTVASSQWASRALSWMIFAAGMFATSFASAATDAGPGPCDDFYAYACGPWLASHPIPADHSSWDPYFELAQKNAEALRAVLEGHDVGISEEARKVADLYASCMDQATIEDGGLSPLAPEIKRIEAVQSPAQAAAELATLQILDVDTIFTLSASQHPAKADQIIARMDMPELGMTDREYYLSDTAESLRLKTAYRAHVQQMLELSGLSAKAADAGAETVLSLETALAKVTPSNEQRRDPTTQHHVLPYAQLVALAPSFPWSDYFSALGIPTPNEIDVSAPDYLRAALKSWLELSAEQQRAYFRWQLVSTLSIDLPARFIDADFDFYGKALHGTQQPAPRWKRCTRLTNRHLGEAVGRVFVASHFPAASKEKVLSMIRAIQSALRDDIISLDWMSPATRKEALAKLDAFRIKVGYPDHWRDYSALEIRRNDAMGNTLRARRFEHARQMSKIGKPVDRDEWFSLPQDVDGYESDGLVEVVFTAGLLQPPFFDASLDDAANFGAIGRVIGHEFTHGFDDNGRHYDHAGNLRDWWSPADAKAFQQRAQCFVDEYSKFVVVDDQKLNGQLTLGENLADNAGMRLVYAALEARKAGASSAKVNGLTPEQKLFTSFAQTQCTNTNAATLRNRLLTDPHSPGRFRVNGTLANMLEFQQAFSCKAGDAMVSPHPCRLW